MMDQQDYAQQGQAGNAMAGTGRMSTAPALHSKLLKGPGRLNAENPRTERKRTQICLRMS